MNFIRNRNFRAGPQTSLEGFICTQNSDKKQKIKVFGRSDGGASIILLGCFTIIGLFAAYRDFPLSKTLAEFVLLPIVALGYVWKKKARTLGLTYLSF